MDVGKFKSIGFIGGGNFGNVFRVHDTLLNVERALNYLKTSLAQGYPKKQIVRSLLASKYSKKSI